MDLPSLSVGGRCRARRPGVRACALTCVLAVALVACVGPARTDATYRGKAASTADDIRSSVETAIVGVEAAHRHGLQAAYVSVLVAEAEEDAAAIESTFASIQPPSRRSDRARRETLEVTGEAVDLLAQLRIRARRGGERALAVLLPDLHRSSADLDELASDLRSGRTPRVETGG